MTDTDTTHNGWTNRETWAANLWITNDQGLYESALERIRGVRERYPQDAADSTSPHYGAELKSWWDELTDPNEGLMSCSEILDMIRDVGWEPRINWEEIAASLAE